MVLIEQRFKSTNNILLLYCSDTCAFEHLVMSMFSLNVCYLYILINVLCNQLSLFTGHKHSNMRLCSPETIWKKKIIVLITVKVYVLAPIISS